MKRVLKVWLWLVLLVGIGVVITNPASASPKIKIKSLASGKVALSNYYYNKDNTTIYKIKVKKAGYITISGNSNIYLKIYKSKPEYKNEFELQGEEYQASAYNASTAETSIKYYPIDKGTYYLYLCHYGNNDNYNFKYTFTAVSMSKKNYCRALATTLKAKQEETICTPFGYERDYWYKVVLTKKQRLKIKFDNMNKNDTTDFSVYDSNWREVKLVHDDGVDYASYNKLTKGIYYIHVSGNFISYRSSDNIRLCKLSWK